MDRAIVYPLEQIKAIDICRTNLFSMIGIGKLAKAILGSGPLLNDLDCIPDSPASLDVFLNPGEIYILEDIDTTAYGPLPPDTTHQIIKQGILLDAQSFTITPPSTPGDSINYLIQITYSDSDTDTENRPFFNQPAQNVSTVRSGLLVATLKAGTAAPTGTQTTPPPDAGYTGAWVVTVANGQTQIISGDISKYTNAPFITEKLGDKIDQSFADSRYGQITQIQAGAYLYGVDTGGVNALVASITPNITSLYVGMEVHIKVANTNTGFATLNLNSLGVKNIVLENGNAIGKGALTSGMIAILAYDGTEFRLQNPASTSSIITNGYKIDPDGLIRQWGSLSIPFLSTEQSVSQNVILPIPFDSSVFSIIPSVYTDSSLTVIVANIINPSITNFDFVVSTTSAFGASGTFPCSWMALGK